MLMQNIRDLLNNINFSSSNNNSMKSTTNNIIIIMVLANIQVLLLRQLLNSVVDKYLVADDLAALLKQVDLQ